MNHVGQGGRVVAVASAVGSSSPEKRALALALELKFEKTQSVRGSLNESIRQIAVVSFGSKEVFVKSLSGTGASDTRKSPSSCVFS